jgi:cytochrome c-type biogenesis protein CcmF
MLVQRSHGSLRRTNITLALLAYITVFYSTFLTRSGVLSNFSVHTFVAEGIYGVMLTFLLLLLIGSAALLVYRWRDIPSRPLSDKFFSRDSFFVLAILTLGIIAAVVTLGTSMPLISGIPGVGHWLQGMLGGMFELDDGSALGGEPFTDGRFNMAVSFYQITTPPLGIVAVALMIVAPLLGWRDSNMRHLLRALRWPAVAAVLAACGALLLGVREPLSLSYVTLSVFAAGTNIVMIIRTLKSGWLRIGGYLAHVGLAILLIGVVGSSAYASPDERLAITAGDSMGFQDYTITFNDWQQTEDGGGVLDLTVQRGDEVFKASPELYFDTRMGTWIQNPSIKSYIWQDLYVSPADYVPAEDPTRPVMGVGDAVEIGPYQIVFTDFDLDMQGMMAGGMADVGAKLQVLYEGQESTVIPRLQLVRDEQTGEATYQYQPVALPGGHTLTLSSLYPSERLIILQAEGAGLDALPVEPARAVITVSTKPLVLLVWVGLMVGILGGTIAFFRRYLEGQARLSGQPARLPRGLGALPGRLGWRGGSAAR